MQQFIETIGTVEPSFVIRKVSTRCHHTLMLKRLQYLDGSRTDLLCRYLEVMHKKRLDSGDHSTLLLSAYIKLNATERIYQFVDRLGDVNDFNLDKTIMVRFYKSSIDLQRV